MVFFQVWSETSHLEPAMKKELEALLTKASNILTEEKEIKPALNTFFPKLFNFRMRAIKWVLDRKQPLNVEEGMEKMDRIRETIRENDRIEIIIENILFYLRCNKRILESVIGTGTVSEKHLKTDTNQLPLATYEQFLSTLALSVPNSESAQKLIDQIHNSLYVDFALLSVLLLINEELEVSRKVTDELAFMVADAAQECTAYALESGILESDRKQLSFLTSSTDSAFIKEQKSIAETGIDDFADTF